MPTSHTWRCLFRALLRESSYLPDPIARAYVHAHVVQRFRRYANPPLDQRKDILWQSARRKSALQSLSVLRRANEGYSKPLEKVLRLSYGRIGKRRRELLATIVTPEVPPDNVAVADVLKKPGLFADGWEPPSLVLALLKSQDSHFAIPRLGALPRVRSFAPPIPAQNSWGRPTPLSRRRNIRKRWYGAALDSLYPPLPDTELNILEGLMSGTMPWTPIRRRKAIATPSAPKDLVAFLAEGPQKGHTFRAYAAGRPHKITRRFMRRLWHRVSCLVPRISWNEAGQKHRIVWDSMKPSPDLSFEVDDGPASKFGIKHE